MFDAEYHEALVNELLSEAKVLDDGKNTPAIQRIEWLVKAVIAHGREKGNGTTQQSVPAATSDPLTP